MSNKIARRQLFDLYADNWGAVKQDPGIHVKPDLDDVFVCPLCFQLYSRKELENDLLALEHVPPKAMGGKDRECTLTCRKCNNDTGSQLESFLKSELEAVDLFAGIPGASIDVKYSPRPGGEGMWLPATLKSKSGGFDILGHPQRAHPQLIETVSEEDFMREVTEFKMKFLTHPQNAAVALLKVAYLSVFRLFGYAALIPESMQSVRRQIMNPFEPILPRRWIVRWPFLDDYLGVSFLFWSEDLRAYLVTFDLDSGRRTRRFGVVLPQPDDADLKVYDHLLSRSSSKAVLFALKGEVDFVRKPFDVFSLWKQCISDLMSESSGSSMI